MRLRWAPLWWTHAQNGGVAHHAFVARLVANWVARRARTDAERTTNVPDATALAGIVDALRVLTPLCAGSDNKTVASSFALLLHNAASWIGRFQRPDSPLYPLLAAALKEYLAKDRDEKSLYYALVALGALILANEAANRPLVTTTFGPALPALLSRVAALPNESLAKVVVDLKKVLASK